MTVLWAHYGITRARYARDRNMVEIVEVARISGDEFVPSGSMERAEVVHLITHGYRFCTVMNGSSSVLNRGKRVNVVWTMGSQFLRTDDRVEPRDHLGDLPEF